MKAALLVLMAVVASGCATDLASTVTTPPIVSVHTAVARLEPLAGEFDAGGAVRARTRAVLASRIMSPIVQVTVKPGDRVKSGQVLIRLDARQLHAGQARADAALSALLEGAAAVEAEAEGTAAALSLARVSHGRIARLAERQVATPAEIDTAVADLQAADARMKAATARRAEVASSIEAARAAARSVTLDASFATITAPFDGVVTERAAEPGSLAVPGTPLMVVEDVRQFRLEVSVDAASTTGIAVGSRVPITIDGIGLVDGVVAEAAPAVDAAHSYTIKLSIPMAAGLRSGLYGRARLRGVAQRHVTIPLAALVRRGQLTLVFIDDHGTARLRYVHAGTPVGDRLPILSGIAENERVVLNPPATVSDGTLVSASQPRGQP